MSTAIERSCVEARGHVALFYERERELIEAAVAYLAGALGADRPAVVIATGSHLAVIEAQLVELGIEVADARIAGRWITADADVTLARLLRDGRPDAGRFEATVWPLLRQAASVAAANGTEVSVYGEMVGLLWDAGQVDSVMSLEELWNDAGRRFAFGLLCAYPAGPVVLDRQPGALGDVCRLHTGMVASDRVSRTLPVSAVSPRAARRFATEILRGWGAPISTLDDAALIVTELATNAVLHARSRFCVVVSRDGDVVRIAVEDDNDALPVVRTPDPGVASGRGLNLVTELAERWGVERLPEGKAVWAELAHVAGGAISAPGPV